MSSAPWERVMALAKAALWELVAAPAPVKAGAALQELTLRVEFAPGLAWGETLPRTSEVLHQTGRIPRLAGPEEPEQVITISLPSAASSHMISIQRVF